MLLNSNIQEKSTENDVYMIRKLLEQIHNYFEYLDCPFYNPDLPERDLLLLLIEPSMKRYKVIEWMLNRLEPDMDFHLPKILKDNKRVGDCILDKKEDTIDAIVFLKNLGLSYSRVMVPDIVHAKVSPLIQLKFLVRLLRIIRLKSWNRRPVLRHQTYKNQLEELRKKSNKANSNAINGIANDGDCVVKELEMEGDEKICFNDLFEFINHKIKNNPIAKTILHSLEVRLNDDRLEKFNQRLYLTIMERLKISINKSNEIHQAKGQIQEQFMTKEKEKALKINLNDKEINFEDGMIQLISDELLAPKYQKDFMNEYSSIYFSNIDGYESCGSINQHSEDYSEDNDEKFNNDMDNLLKFHPPITETMTTKDFSSTATSIKTNKKSEKTRDKSCDKSQSVKSNASSKTSKKQLKSISSSSNNNKSSSTKNNFTTKVKLDRNMNMATEYHGDNLPQPKPRFNNSKVVSKRFIPAANQYEF